MAFPNFYKVLAIILAIVLVGVLAMFGTLWVKNYRESSHLAARQAESATALATAKETIGYQEEYLLRMEQDPEFFERVVRQRLGYSRPDEVIFKFED